MTDEDLRVHGLRGYKRHVDPSGYASVLSTAPQALSAPPSANFTYGRTKYGMQGNATLPNCFFAADVHCETVQATLGFSGGVASYVAGFTVPNAEAGAQRYAEYVKSQGQQMPGSGTDPYSGTTFLLNNGYAKYGAVLGPTGRTPEGVPVFDLNVVKEAIYDFQGGVIACLALDADAEKEFDDHVPWGTLSNVPDAQDGHAVTLAVYEQGNPVTTCITWAALEGMLEEFDLNCLEGLVLLITEGFIVKNGQPATDALVAKWQLQTAPAAGATHEGFLEKVEHIVDEVKEEVEDLLGDAPESAPEADVSVHEVEPAPIDTPEDVAAHTSFLQNFEHRLRDILGLVLTRVTEQELITELEDLLKDATSGRL